MQITATIPAWMNFEYSDISRIDGLIADGHMDKAVNLPLYSIHGIKGYTQIGTAEITLTLFPASDMHSQQLKALNEQLQEVRAENQRKENYLIDKISKLSALTYEAEA